MNIHKVLEKPMITEKSTILQESGKYTFRVAPKANKVQVKEAVEMSFDVTVVDVNITKTHGKRKRYGSRITKKPDLKKAVVTLAEGDR
ncbi:MAG: 50S ribosomal protein L23, partial [Chloroflexi bacterium]|nr:50S ribosomal protein L23 [Chloroflexota bacterium]